MEENSSNVMVSLPYRLLQNAQQVLTFTDKSQGTRPSLPGTPN
jgi:hypothetical protein